VLPGLAAMVGGIDLPGAAEPEALGDATWWVPAVHAACSPAREQAGRMWRWAGRWADGL